MAFRQDTVTLTLDASTAPGRYPAKICRTGVQHGYPTGPERRDASEVFSADSISTLLNCRVQVSHRDGSPTVGKVVMPFARVELAGESYLRVELEITDPATRGRMDRKELSEISMGYSCELVGGRQTRIRYDHCALLDSNERARCGEHCRVDSVPQQQKVPSPMSCPCSPHIDAVARRDAARATVPHLAHQSDWFVDAYVQFQDACARQDADRAALHDRMSNAPRVDSDANTVARIDAASLVAGVSSQDVRDYLRMNTRRDATPSQENIDSAVHSVKLRSYFGKAGL
jgi:hypothetical protein